MTELRAAIYARHSTDKQNASSSADQAAACEALVREKGGVTVGIYEDPEISGYRRDRPGLLRMLRDIAEDKIDIVVCEALDRIARDGEDIHWLGKKLSYHRVRLMTATEGEIDEIKLAVAGMLGSMFLSALRVKTLRGLEAVVKGGRLPGGKAYGYRKVIRDDGRGNVINGIFEIDDAQAEVVRRIYREFAAGRSSIQIATSLNMDGVPGPRRGEWNASTIRGDPKKLVGILNNPLDGGKLVWGRREWRKNPDSDRRERRYRLRDTKDWIEIDIPNLRIVDDELLDLVRAEIASRRRVSTKPSNRARHLLSGLICCSECGGSYTLAGKDYYRCSRNRERGTCENAASMRVAHVEEAVLSALHTQLLTPDHVQLFTEEFRREVERLTRTEGESVTLAKKRVRELETEIGNLAKHFLAGTVSPTLQSMLSEREQEKDRLVRQISIRTPDRPPVVPPPTLIASYERKVAGLRAALNDQTVRAEAIEALRGLISSVTVHIAADGTRTLEVEGSTSTLINFAKTTKAPRRSAGGRSLEVVAGVGFEPTTFRL